MSITFDVNKKAKESLSKTILPTISVKESFASRLSKNTDTSNKVDVEAADCTNTNLVNQRFSHPFIEAVHYSFDAHYPLVLSPDSVWLCIAQGFANHINANSEELRSQFVSHQGQETIVVRRDSFVKDSSTNNWAGVFAEFSDKLSDYIGKKRDLFVSNFSTTTPITKAASEVVLMDGMKSYFKYSVKTYCGIPTITLLGTVQDWKNIRTRAQALSEFNLSWWTDKLLPVLDEFVAAAEEKVNVEFWNSMYKMGSGSGGPFVSGWINTLFPYLESYNGSLYKSRYFENSDYPPMICLDTYTCGLSKVPFKWEFFHETYNMEFLGGFVGFSQDDSSLAISPAIGWAIRQI